MKRLILVLALLALVVVPFAAVSAQEAIELPAVDPLAVSGDIITAGSSTVFPVTEAMAELFIDEGFSGNITVDSIGSGAGFERFCEAGETDVANASRPIRDSEIEACAALTPARTPIEIRVGTDALAVVVSAENDFVTDLTLAQLAQIFSGAATTWDQVDASFPAEAIQLFSPGSDSGTFDYFVEAVLESEDGGNLGDDAEAAILNAPGIQFSEDDNVLVQGVEGSPYAIGYFGYAYYVEEADRLNVLSVGGIAPSAETAEDNSYPLSRPLFIYTDASILAEKPQVAAFVSFYLTNIDEVITQVGYFPASVTAINAAKNAVLGAMGMMGEMSIELPAVDPLAVSGDIITAGSSTVFPVTEAMAELFIDEGFSGNITVDSIGSGAGFERFCEAGETDVANASRPIRDSEIEACAALTPARTPIEIRVGTDALAVVVSAENDFVTDLTLAQLAQIFSGAATTWDQVDASFPAEAIQLFSPGSDSGTFDYFVEAVLESEDGGNLGDDAEAAILNAPGIQFSEDDNVLVQGVEGSPYAIGYFGYAYYVEEADRLNVLSVGGIAPSAETAEDNSYPLSRPLFIYTDASILAEKPQVAAFVNFYLTNIDEVITQVGYFPASDAAINAAKSALIEAMGM